MYFNRVVLRRDECSDSYGLWILAEENRTFYVAKPTELVFEPKSDGFFLGEPTLRISREMALKFFESFIRELEGQGEALTTNKQVIEAKDENLKDLRDIIEKLYNITKY